MTAPDTRDSVTPPDSVERIALEMKAHSVMGSRIAELDEWATRLQALDRQRQEEAKQLAADCLHMYDRFAAAQARAEAAEAALQDAGRDAERYRWLRDKAPDTWDVSRWLDNDTQEIHLQDDLDAAIDAARLVRDGDSGEGES